jgi:hypothetical protein
MLGVITAAAVVLPFLFAFPAQGDAREVRSGWWWSAQTRDGSVPSSVDHGDMAVAQQAYREEMSAAVWFDVSDLASPPSRVVLELTQVSSTLPSTQGGAVLACPATKSWSEAHAGYFGDRPTNLCASSYVVGTRTTEGWSVDLTTFVRQWIEGERVNHGVALMAPRLNAYPAYRVTLRRPASTDIKIASSDGSTGSGGTTGSGGSGDGGGQDDTITPPTTPGTGDLPSAPDAPTPTAPDAGDLPSAPDAPTLGAPDTPSPGAPGFDLGGTVWGNVPRVPSTPDLDSPSVDVPDIPDRPDASLPGLPAPPSDQPGLEAPSFGAFPGLHDPGSAAGSDPGTRRSGVRGLSQPDDLPGWLRDDVADSGWISSGSGPASGDERDMEIASPIAAGSDGARDGDSPAGPLAWLAALAALATGAGVETTRRRLRQR